MIGRDWIAGEACALVLGDNLIFGDHLSALLRSAATRAEGATVFAYQVRDPERYGVVIVRPARPARHDRREAGRAAVELGGDRRSISTTTRSATWRAPIRPSPRGELEITELNQVYLEAGALHVERLSRGCAWLDAGTPDSLLQAATFVQTIQSRQGMLVGCPEEVAFRMGYIDAPTAARARPRAGQDRARPGAAELAEGEHA